MARRLALLIGNSQFVDTETFPALRTPTFDAQDCASMLQKHGDFEIVGLLLDEDAQVIRREMERFFNQAQRGDLVLLYYSGHGYKDTKGYLYLVARDTQTQELLTTGVRESFVRDAMSYSRSRHKVIILDCCFSGALIEDRKSGTESLVLDALSGEVTALLTSSSTIQYSFEEQGRNSLFTQYLLEGIETGQADENGDGRISVDELFEYVAPRVEARRSEQTPMKQVSARVSEVIIANSPHPPAPIVSRLLIEGPLVPLREVVAQHMPVSHWLKRLDVEETRGWIRAFEERQDDGIDAPDEGARRKQALLILGVSDQDVAKRPASDDFGPLTWIAAAHPQPVYRETAAQALLVTYGAAALARVEAAGQEGGLSRWRLAELRGILFDADPEIEEADRTRPPRDRFEIWWWRFRRRFARDFGYIFGLALGGAIGGGLGLGFLRFLLAALLGEGSGLAFYIAFAPGFAFGGALSFGLVLTNVVRLQPPRYAPPGTVRRPLLPAVVLGSLFFALMHVLITLLLGTPGLVLNVRGLIDAPLILPLALVSGAGLSLAVYDQPLAGWRMSPGRWLLRLAVVAAVFALAQALFVLARDYGTGLMFVWDGSLYESRMEDNLIAWGMEGVYATRNWFHYAAIIDAALAGIALAVGLTVGLVVAGNWYQERGSMVRRASD
jgi:uncharacterized caspase-like protein